MRCLPLLLCCAIVPFLPAQTTPQTGTSAQNRSVVEGVILNELTKEPIRRVEVRLIKMSGQTPGLTVGPAAAANSVATDAEGKFRFENVEPGNYSISFQRQGFMGSRQGGGFPMPGSALLTVAEGTDVKGLRYTLLPQGVVAGRVLDDEGEPVQGASVFLMARRYQQGGRQWTPMNGGPTNDRGEFRIPNVSPGAYLLGAQPSMLASMTHSAPSAPGQPQLSYVTTYYPGVTSTSEGTPITVRVGAEITNVDIPLRKQPTYSIRGTAADENGKPLTSPPGFFVNLMPDGSGGMMPAGRTSQVKENEFQIVGVPPGRYTLVLRTQAAGFDQMRSGTLPVEVTNGDVDGVAIRLHRGSAVSGTVVVEGPGEKPPVSGIQVNLLPLGGAARIAPTRNTATAKEDGSFSIANVGPGRYLVLAYGQGTRNTYSGGIQGPGGVSKAGVLEVTGSDIADLRVFLRTAPPVLHGTVEGGTGTGEAQTLLAVLRSTDKEALDAGAPNTEVTRPVTQGGTFDFIGQAPGEYKLWVFRNYESGAVRDPEVFARVAGAAVTVTLAQGQSSSATVKVTEMPKE